MKESPDQLTADEGEFTEGADEAGYVGATPLAGSGPDAAGHSAPSWHGRAGLAFRAAPEGAARPEG
ncbi:hypothetical protein AB0M86_20345 [Streptomyces sp. NPDC051639]|uniref:hypothetical protein n=1 Tax=Streptomyces sp. NPDC051639 TaxID=3155671 RepID=UPI0034357647